MILMPNNVAKGFIPEIFDASVLRTLEDNLVLKKICNLKPTKDIAKAGDTVYFTDLADPTITDYTGTITHEALIDSQIALLINKEKTFAFKVNDEDRLMANVDLKGSQAQRAAYNLKRAIEVDVIGSATGVVADAAAGTITDNCTSASILSQMGALQQYLAEANVAETNMWAIIPPWVQLKLKLAGVKFSINSGINGKGGMAWTQDLGFDVFVTNTVYNSNTAAAPVSHILAGSYQSVGYADKMLNTRSFELQATRAIGIDGGCIYGFKTIKPKELAKAVLTWVAETTI
jgi:hypothetical protein